MRQTFRHPTLAAGAAVLLLVFSADALAASARYASSSNRIYVENGGSMTLSQIKAALPKAPLDLVDSANRIWLLRANIQIEDGSILVLHGSANGGDVNELRLKSDSGGFVQITADHGGIDIEATKIRSWNASANAPDTNHGDGRAFMRVRSKLSSSGAALESRMDVIDSEISYLGYAASESYGLVWKVNGSGSGLYDKVQVRGNIIGSHIHHNYFGVYTFGHQDGLWRDNEVSHNVQYGFDPHDDSDDLIIENNEVHHNGNHGIIASKRCDHVVIRDNRSYANTGNGIMLHRSSDDGLVEGNETFDNSDSGVAIFASRRIQIRNNIVRDNGKYGMRFSMSASDNQIEDNEISGSGSHGFYFYRGSDTPEPGDDGRNRGNVFVGNTVTGSGSDAIKMSDSDGTRFTGNTFSANGTSFSFIRSADTVFAGNGLPTNVTIKLTGTSEDSSSAEFSAQERIKVQLDDFSTALFTDADNAIFDPDESVYTLADGDSSSMSLSTAQIGTTSTVFTRKLFAYPSGSTVQVNPTVWNTGGDRSKAWKARLAGSSGSVQYVVGDLAPGTRYAVDQNSTRLGLFTADAAGRITFTARPGTTSILTYSVKPG